MYVCVSIYIGGAVALGMAGGAGMEVVVVQGDTFDINFECVDSNGSLTTLGISKYSILYYYCGVCVCREWEEFQSLGGHSEEGKLEILSQLRKNLTSAGHRV